MLLQVPHFKQAPVLAPVFEREPQVPLIAAWRKLGASPWKMKRA